MHILFKLNKGKGILVLLYFVICTIVPTAIIAALARNVGGFFLKIDFYSNIGITFMLTSIWTYLTKDDFYKDKEGNKVKMDTVNSFIFLPMKVWAIIFLLAAVIFLGNSFFHYFPPENL